MTYRTVYGHLDNIIERLISSSGQDEKLGKALFLVWNAYNRGEIDEICDCISEFANDKIRREARDD